MNYAWLTYIAASSFLTLGLVMLYRLITRLRGATFGEMTLQTKFGLVVFVVLLAYCSTRSAYLFAQAAGAFSESALNTTTNFVAAIPATLFLVLQSTLLYKWNLHVSDVTEVLHQDRFRVGGTLIASSIGLSISCIIIAIVGACSIHSSNGLFSGTEWVILLSLFFGVSYSFNGWSFLALGLYLRWLWTPNTPKAKKASYRILGIAVIFGLCCATRGAIICYFIRPHIDGSSLSASVKEASHYAQTVIYLCECACLSISLVYLTSTDSNNKNKNNNNAATFKGPTAITKESLEQAANSPDNRLLASDSAADSEYGAYAQQHTTTAININGHNNGSNIYQQRAPSGLGAPINTSYLGNGSNITLSTVPSSVANDAATLGTSVARSKIASAYAAKNNSSVDAMVPDVSVSPSTQSNTGGSSRRNQNFSTSGSYRESQSSGSHRESKKIGHITINRNSNGPRPPLKTSSRSSENIDQREPAQ